MIEVGFSIILGFAIASTLCGVLADNSRGDRILMRVLAYLVVLSALLGYSKDGTLSVLGQSQYLVVMSFMENYLWLALGAAVAVFLQLIAEGHVHAIWVKLHPQSAPTPEARFGQRARPAGPAKPVQATLVGTSTEYLNSGLDLRTDTLIRLCYYAFEDRGALTLSRLESNLRLGTGRRQKSFHKIAAGMRKRPKLKPTIHRYCRSINGSVRMSQQLFGDLCRLARYTDNRDFATIDRLNQTGRALGLPEDEMRRLING